MKKNDWKKQNEETLKQLTNTITTIGESFTSSPETIAELMAFSAKFYQYSYRNNVLIQHQYPHSTYMSSFKAWENMGYHVQKGEKGTKILVPVEATYIHLDEHTKVSLMKATPEQKEGLKSGKYRSSKERHYSYGNVFDISQTNCPVEEYPSYFHGGYADENQAALVEGLCAYNSNHLNVTVTTADVKSISMKGYYSRDDDSITLNRLLKDSDRLYILAHETGHAILHKYRGSLPTEIKEFEADSFAIMLQERLGYPLTESAKRHLASQYRKIQKENTKSEKPIEIEKMISDVYKVFREEYPKIEKEMESSIQNSKNQHFISSDPEIPEMCTYHLYRPEGYCKLKFFDFPENSDRYRKKHTGEIEYNPDSEELCENLYDRFLKPTYVKGMDIRIEDVIGIVNPDTNIEEFFLVTNDDFVKLPTFTAPNPAERKEFFNLHIYQDPNNHSIPHTGQAIDGKSFNEIFSCTIEKRNVDEVLNYVKEYKSVSEGDVIGVTPWNDSQQFYYVDTAGFKKFESFTPPHTAHELHRDKGKSVKNQKASEQLSKKQSTTKKTTRGYGLEM